MQKKLGSDTQSRVNFLACIKAYLENVVNFKKSCI